MIYDNLKEWAEIIKTDELYNKSLEFMLSVISNRNYGDDGGRERSIFSDFSLCVASNKWGRRKAIAFCKNLFHEVNEKNINTDITNDELESVSTGLLGYCSPNSIIRFPKDPDDMMVLRDYVLSEKWFNEEFYSGNL